MCFFKSAKLKGLEEQNNKLSNEVLELKKKLLKATEERCNLLDSCIEVIEKSVTDPDKKSECLLKLGKYKKEEKKEPEPSKEKKIFIITIEEDDKLKFEENYEDLAKDLELQVECKKIATTDDDEIKYKLIISYDWRKSPNISRLWDLLDKTLEYEFEWEEF